MIANKHGLHARAVTQFVQLANRFESKIEVSNGALAVDGKSIMSMLRLGATRGTMLTIKAAGSDAEGALRSLSELVAARFGEE
jgi:phosphotransferase system HPr (HPr) family protein